LPGTIVLAEDDGALRESLAEFLRDQEYTVLTARDGVEVLELLSQRTPDVILTDLLMPAMHGSDLLAAIRINQSYDHVPIIVMSAYLQQWTARVSGADHVLSKPLDTKQLLSILRRYCPAPR